MSGEFERGSQPTCLLQKHGDEREAQQGARRVASILGIFVEVLGSDRVKSGVQVGGGGSLGLGWRVGGEWVEIGQWAKYSAYRAGIG